MVVNKSIGERIFDAFNVLLLTLLTIACVYPLLYVLFASVSDPLAIVSYRGILLRPLGLSFDAYRAVFRNPHIAIGYKNTLFVVVVGTTINIFFTSLAAYGLSRKNVLLKNIIMRGITFTMMFSGGLIPTYLTVRDLGLINSRFALILPSAISTWNLIIMRTSFQSIPDSLEESARIDGANDFVILFRIVIPLSTAVIAVMILFYGVHHWNSWFPAAMYIRDREKYPLQLILREILIQQSTDSMLTDVSSEDKMPIGETIKYATIIVSTLPVLVIYPFLQKYFVKGVMVGAIKG